MVKSFYYKVGADADAPADAMCTTAVMSSGISVVAGTASQSIISGSSKNAHAPAVAAMCTVPVALFFMQLKEASRKATNTIVAAVQN